MMAQWLLLLGKRKYKYFHNRQGDLYTCGMELFSKIYHLLVFKSVVLTQSGFICFWSAEQEFRV